MSGHVFMAQRFGTLCGVCAKARGGDHVSEGHYFTPDSLATAVREAGRTNRYIGYLSNDDCRLIIQAAKEDER